MQHRDLVGILTPLPLILEARKAQGQGGPIPWEARNSINSRQMQGLILNL